MVFVTQYELQGVFARRQRQRCIGLPLAEMNMRIILRKRLAQIRYIAVNHQMVMAAVGFVGARRNDLPPGGGTDW